MAHVFVVDDSTISTHLKYMFAGTGAKDLSCEFLYNYEMPAVSSERLLTEMIADISRIKVGDDILFYLLQKKEVHEGLFFGSFKAISKSFLCNDGYLEDKGLGKHLTFRILIKPNEVYPKGITERECLDSLEGIRYPYEMCWSLIYRKLNANRGCTMINNYEYDLIMGKIRKANDYVSLSNQTCLDYDYDKCEIISSNSKEKYEGYLKSLDIKNRLLTKYQRYNKYEVHLQAYLLQHFEELEVLKVTNNKVTWLGNEVHCGVGMQSIDIAFLEENDLETHFVICELKCVQPKMEIESQINKYIDWIKDYFAPLYHKKFIIHPTIVAPYPTKKTKEIFTNMKDNVKNSSGKISVEPIRYITVDFENNDIILKELANE